MSEPTKAAMRAAKLVIDPRRTREETAEVIDREFPGHEEMKAALRRIYQMTNGQDLLNIGRQIAYDALRKAGEP